LFFIDEEGGVNSDINYSKIKISRRQKIADRHEKQKIRINV
jgi:hypothetical protein